MKNSENVAVVKKVRASKKANVVKNQIMVIETIENKKIVLNKIQKAIKMIQKVSGATQENVVDFLIRNLASQNSKVKISEHLTKMVLKIASGTLTIPNDLKTKSTEIFVEQMVNQFGFEKNQLEKFIVNDLSTKKKIVLNVYYKDLFFKASTKPEFVAKIKALKRF